MIETYVEFLALGKVVSEIYATRKVSSRSVADLDVPKQAFGFRFFDIHSTRSNDVAMKSNHLNESPLYCYGGEVHTLQEIKDRNDPEDSMMIRNMEREGHDIFHTRHDRWIFFTDGMVHIPMMEAT